jgi:outer membrane lipoprotein-sorting protein
MRYSIWVMAALLLPAAQAQEKLDAAEVLRRVTEAYTNVKQFQLAGKAKIVTTAVSDGAITDQSTHELLIALQEPDRVRVEMTPGNPDEDAIYVISDGRDGWAYSPRRNEYMKVKPGRVPGTPLGDSDVTEDAIVPYAIQVAHQGLEPFKFPPQLQTSIVGEETLTVKGTAYRCIVVSIEGRPFPKSTAKLWIDKARNVVLREDSRTPAGNVTESISTVYSTVRLNAHLPDELFKFTPPPGAKLVERIGR